MRKLILLIVTIAILNCVHLAHAAPAHFSMVELRNKLSKIILEQYPDSHVDNSVFTIDATNMKCTSDDCAEKPRADSVDFRFRVSVGVDIAQQQMLFSSESNTFSSKPMAGKRYDLKVLPERANRENSVVHYDSWTYGAYHKLVRAGVTEFIHSQIGPTLLPVTRFEFAVAIARLLDKKSERAKDSDEVKQLISELAVEFAPEVAELCIPTKPSEVPIGGIESWPYDVIEQLIILGIKFDVPLSLGTAKPMTRYEFAVAVARLLDNKTERANDSLKVKALIAKLALEFEHELLALNFPLNHQQMVADLKGDKTVWHQRYEYLQLNLDYGKKFDGKLRKKIEKTVAEYVLRYSDLGRSK